MSAALDEVLDLATRAGDDAARAAAVLEVAEAALAEAEARMRGAAPGRAPPPAA